MKMQKFDENARNLMLGIYDAPLEQKQPVLEVDLMKNNIAVFGSPKSGKTTFIKNLLIRLHEKVKPQILGECVYILDFGGEIGEYEKLPYICGCFDDSNEENVKRIFKSVEKQMKNYNANKKDSNGKDIPYHTTLIIENINAFVGDERYEMYQDVLLKICRDGISKMVSVIFTASDTSGISRYVSNAGVKIAFDMPDDKLMDVYGARPPRLMHLPGRGIVNIGSSLYEFQSFLPFRSEDDLAVFLKNIGKDLDRLVRSSDKTYLMERLKGFDKVLTKDNFSDYSEKHIRYEECDKDDESIVVGLDYYEHKPVYIDIESSRCFAIYGKKGYGKTNLLKLLVKSYLEKKQVKYVVLYDDGRKQLENLSEYISGKYPQIEVQKTSTPQEFKKHIIDKYFRFGSNVSEFMKTVQRETLFILQSKSLYQSGTGGSSIEKGIEEYLSQMVAISEEKDWFFIFSDVRKHADASAGIMMNTMFSTAFLLDSIGDFVADKGQKSVFGDMDAKELKNEYARCEVGDGYVFHIERDELTKLKFIKSDI